MWVHARSPGCSVRCRGRIIINIFNKIINKNINLFIELLSFEATAQPACTAYNSTGRMSVLRAALRLRLPLAGVQINPVRTSRYVLLNDFCRAPTTIGGAVSLAV